MQREYWHKIFINNRSFKRVLIDDHYEKRHSSTMNDSLILGLVKSLENQDFAPEVVKESGFSIFVTEPLWFLDRPYRLIWTTHPDKNFVGVINAFRRKRGKKI